ncbi:hypothetical protein [Mycolicibacterium mengxianglii]|uniref:hypothetical protein n=1 Tax=Mycolicibacterium mengxianglii TaxID=2736649 RepID=UPI0018D0DB44|nr:hypothetical protein [Mycolicibacterium mengxianglii]
MMFPTRALLATSGVALLASTGLSYAGAANAEGPPLHHVRYTVTANEPFFADIYYREREPAVFADYSHDPYVFSPRARVDVGPDQPWVFDAMLADPALWAMVVVQSGESVGFPTPGFNCTLEVDGVVVKTDSGPSGALCSIRNW